MSTTFSGQFDPENLGSENLFNPMLLEELQKYPVDPSSLYRFREHKPGKRDKGSWCTFN